MQKIKKIICSLLVIFSVSFVLMACGSEEQNIDNVDNEQNNQPDIKLVLKNTNQKIDEANNTLASYYNDSNITPSSIGVLSLMAQSVDEYIYNLFTIGKDNYRQAISERDWLVNPILKKYAMIEYIYWKYGNDIFGINYDVQQDVCDYGNVHVSIYFNITCVGNTLTMDFSSPNYDNDTLVQNNLCHTTLTFDDYHNPLSLSVNIQDYTYTDKGHGIYLKHQTITYDFQNNHIISMSFKYPDTSLTFAEISNKTVMTKEWLKAKTDFAEYIDFNLNDIAKSQIITKNGTCNGGNYKDEAWQIIMEQYLAFDFFDQQTFIDKLKVNLQICSKEDGNAVCNYCENNYKFVYDATTNKFTYIRKYDFYGQPLER